MSFLFCMYGLNMPLQMLIKTKFVTTDVTIKWFLLLMNTIYVLLHGFFGGKTCFTNVTSKWLFAFMDCGNMVICMTSLFEDEIAKTTDISPEPIMNRVDMHF